MERLIDQVEQWFKDRNLHIQDSGRQLIKLGEEFGELCSAHAKSNEELKKDSIGDILVVLIGYCLQENLNINDCLSGAYDEIKNRKGKVVNGIFVKE